MRKIVLLVSLFLVYFVSTAYCQNSKTTSDANLKYKSIDGGWEVVGYVKNPEGKLFVPEWLLDQKVIAIADSVFLGCDKLEKVELGNVRIIGERAFYRCIGLKSIVMQSIKKIKLEAFMLSEKLKNVDMPKSGVSIGIDAFKGTKYEEK